MRPVLVGLLLVVDAFGVAGLGIGRPDGWLPPFIAFGSMLVGLIWFKGWAMRHRHDDSERSARRLIISFRSTDSWGRERSRCAS